MIAYKTKNFLYIVYSIVIIFLLFYSVEGFLLKGSVYDYDLSIMEGVVVGIDSIPEQLVVARNGSYSFNVDPGSYIITIYTPLNGSLFEIYNEGINISPSSPQIINHDIILPIEVDESLFEDSFSDTETLVGNSLSLKFRWIIPLILLFFIIFVTLFLFYQRKNTVKTLLSSEEVRLLNILKEHGGRMSQRDIVKFFGYSNAKISILLGHLEERGLLKRYKKGRGNIIILEKNKF